MSYDLVIEDVPTFIKRIGDRVIKGSNNSIMILGTDRSANGVADLSSGFGNTTSPDAGVGAGSQHLIVGRSGPHPDFVNDSSYLYLSMKTAADEVMGTTGIPSNHNVESAVTSAILCKSDVVRISARENIKFVVGNSSILISDNEIIIDSPSLRFGASSTLNEMQRSELIESAILTHNHTTPAGPTTSVISLGDILRLISESSRIQH